MASLNLFQSKLAWLQKQVNYLPTHHAKKLPIVLNEIFPD
jgi:hypothetical protein